MQSCGDNTKQLISLIEDTMRRRAELVPISSSISSPNAVSTSPARSNFLSVFHVYLSKYVTLFPMVISWMLMQYRKKVERRLAPHIPGSFLFYLNRYVPNALYIGIVQDAPQQSMLLFINPFLCGYVEKKKTNIPLESFIA